MKSRTDVENLLSPRRCAPNWRAGSSRQVFRSHGAAESVRFFRELAGSASRLGVAAPFEAGVIHKPGEPPEGGCKLKLAPHRLQALGWPQRTLDSVTTPRSHGVAQRRPLPCDRRP